MTSTLGIRREDKNRWERRVPLTPHDIHHLKEHYGIETVIQPSAIRVFSDQEFRRAGATIQDALCPSSVIFAVKEIPSEVFEPKKTYVFFSHTIKGQSQNMPMLKKMMQLGCTLIDYERIVDQSGKRLVFFGRYAGLAGMVDTLWAYGQRMKWEGTPSPFQKIQQTIQYRNLEDIKKHLMVVGKDIKTKGLPPSLTPLVIGFAGYGNVSNGAQEILDFLPVEEITPEKLSSVFEHPSNKALYKVVFKEGHMMEPVKPGAHFELQDYYNHPENYRSVFERYVPFLSILMNCVFWSARYPRFITKEYMKKSFTMNKHLGPKVVGDISADVHGAVEFTEKTTSPDSPVFVYNPLTNTIQDGFFGEGIVVMSVDNLPCELPVESSESFSQTLLRFVPEIMNADFTVPSFDSLTLPPEVKNAVIVYQGKLTPNYQYINKFL